MEFAVSREVLVAGPSIQGLVEVTSDFETIALQEASTYFVRPSR